MMVEELILNGGVDVVKIGIGPGSACTTRLKTGVGVPQLSAVMECSDAAHGVGGKIIADGGITCPGDVGKAFGAGGGSQHKEDFTRGMNLDGTGATRCRLFTSKIGLGPLTHMEEMINEWLDSENIEIKHVGHVIGTMEGKRAEDNVLVLVWY